MQKKQDFGCLWQIESARHLKFGRLISYCLSVVTLLTFCFALIAVPVSGANAPGGGIPYPYLNTLQQFPRDFIWQYCALLLLITYVIQYKIVSLVINKEEKIYLSLGFIFAVISTVILLSDYYIQLNVVPVSLQYSETEGLPLLIQYNPHGIFIALEELGYICMLISFFWFIPAFWNKEYHSRQISLINSAGIGIVIISFVVFSLEYGLDRKDRFETLIISIVFLLMVVNGILLGNRMKKIE